MNATQQSQPLPDGNKSLRCTGSPHSIYTVSVSISLCSTNEQATTSFWPQTSPSLPVVQSHVLRMQSHHSLLFKYNNSKKTHARQHPPLPRAGAKNSTSIICCCVRTSIRMRRRHIPFDSNVNTAIKYTKYNPSTLGQKPPPVVAETHSDGGRMRVVVRY